MNSRQDDLKDILVYTYLYMYKYEVLRVCHRLMGRWAGLPPENTLGFQSVVAGGLGGLELQPLRRINPTRSARLVDLHVSKRQPGTL